MLPVVINFVLFQTVWAISLTGVVYGYPWWGLASLVVFISWHLLTAGTARADLLLALTAVGVGLMVDTLFIQTGLIRYEGRLLYSGIAPLWILGLWANFGLTMNGCMGWLRQRKRLASVLALFFGPLSYYFGIELGAATVRGSAWLLYISIGIAWAIALPVLLELAVRYARRFPPPEQPVAGPTR